MHILILGGTTEASELARLIARSGNIAATLSLAGRTQNPAAAPIPARSGGFGGAAGLARWMRDHDITALVDATHPFAAVMPFNAASAAAETGAPILSLLRPGWQADAGDDWTEADGHEGAIAALGDAPRRVFLTVGRQEVGLYAIAPQHFYVIRSIDPIGPSPVPRAHFVQARGPFDPADELALLREQRIDVIVTKNSGGSATQAKLFAARELGLPVVMIRRPAKPDVPRVETAARALDWILRVHGASP